MAAQPPVVPAAAGEFGSSYLDHSREGKGQGGFYLLGLLVILMAWLIAGSIVTGLLATALTGSVEAVGASDWQRLIIDLLPFSLLAIGVLLAVRLVLGRSARTVVTGRPRVSIRRILAGAGVYAGLLAVTSTVDALLHPGAYVLTWDPARFFPVAVVVLLLIPVQASAEELLFRGYIVQWTSLATDRPGRRMAPIPRLCVLASVSGLVFALPHLANPEARGAELYAWLVWFILGAGWAWVSVLDGRIELAIGAHIANNVFAVLIVGYSASVIPTAGVWTTSVLDFPLMIASTAAVAVAFALITCRRLRPRSGTS
ncbi:MAG: CPBP family intramembrane metalloprotease [Actinobacteria bacterium]|uniref:Unannotated protein n=1 Tax=freshwater metagenome TaxID=449393 RepID=A0A6J7PF29_9ZZZZ|nr:CPBP family intramembrane metalloprotease [Actinomycetota bacterium]